MSRFGSERVPVFLHYFSLARRGDCFCLEDGWWRPLGVGDAFSFTKKKKLAPASPTSKICRETYPFSFQNSPPLVLNSSHGSMLLLPSLKSMVISSPRAPTACPFSTVCPVLTETASSP